MGTRVQSGTFSWCFCFTIKIGNQRERGNHHRQTTSRRLPFNAVHERFRSPETFQAMRIASMAILTLPADRIAFPARNRQKAFQADRIGRPISVLTETETLADLEGGQHTGTVPLIQDTEKLGKLIGLRWALHLSRLFNALSESGRSSQSLRCSGRGSLDSGNQPTPGSSLRCPARSRLVFLSAIPSGN